HVRLAQLGDRRLPRVGGPGFGSLSVPLAADRGPTGTPGEGTEEEEDTEEEKDEKPANGPVKVHAEIPVRPGRPGRPGCGGRFRSRRAARRAGPCSARRSAPGRGRGGFPGT